jgi:hypothetical protein
MARKIFINYRRADDPSHAGRHLRRDARGGESERPEFAHKLPARETGTNSAPCARSTTPAAVHRQFASPPLRKTIFSTCAEAVYSSERLRCPRQRQTYNYPPPLWGTFSGMRTGPLSRVPRGVVRHEDDLAEPQLGDDGVEVPDLIVGGVRVAGWLIRTAPSEEIK